MLFKNRKNNQNKIKIPGKKRQILTTILLSLSLLFGKPRLSSSQSPSSNFNNQPIHERVINDRDREVHLFEDNDRQVILAKAEGTPVTPPTNRGPSNFPTTPSRGLPSRPVITPRVNPFRRAPKLAPGPGAAANPAGAGNGDNAPEGKDQCPAPKKETETSNYSSSSKKKKKKSVKIGTSVVKVNSDSNGNPIFTIEKNNGSKIICTYEQALVKYYHADVHGLKFPKGFDRSHARKLAQFLRKIF